MTVAEGRQFAVAAVQGVATVIALAISTVTFVQQLDLNRDQQILNDYARARDERKYSSRVAFWTVRGEVFSSRIPAGVDMSVQNRAPTPLRNVRILADLDEGGVADTALPDIPPCTIELHRVAVPRGHAFAKTDSQSTEYGRLRLQFTVDGRTWLLTNTELTEPRILEPGSAEKLRTARLDPNGRADEQLLAGSVNVEDCGEGG
jgi:hypothetical protein